MPPGFKECLQRGYEIKQQDSNYCVFPDGNKCPLEEFNQGECGAEYMTEDYCVEEGDPVWEEGKCCSDAEPYLPPGTVGQPTCQDVGVMKKIWDWFIFQKNLFEDIYENYFNV